MVPCCLFGKKRKKVKYDLYLFVRPRKNLQIIDKRKVCPPPLQNNPPKPSSVDLR